MKFVLVLLALVAFSQASHYYWFAGSTSTNVTGLTGTASPTAPYVSTIGPCAVGATATGYQKFTMNVTVPSFWYITALVDRTSLSYAQIQIYNGAYSSADPCANIIRLLSSASGEAPHFADLLWLTPGLYDVVITADDPTGNGYFAVHADSSKGQKDVQTSDNWMGIPYQSTTTCTTSGSAPYTYFVFTPPTNGSYDIFFWSFNATVSVNNLVGSLYNGAVTFLGTGTSGTPADPCTGQPFVASTYGSSTYTDISKSYYDAGVLMNQTLIGGRNYTLVVTSYYSGESNAYGVWWRPSILFSLGNNANYYPPQLSSAYPSGIDEPCNPETSAYLWNSHVLTAQFSTVLIDVGASPDGLDGRTCVYQGNNAGTPFTVAPANCTNVLQCGDTDNSRPLGVSGLAGQTFTVVQMPYYSGISYSGEGYTLWVFSGTQLGPSPAPLSSTGGLSSTSDASAVGAFLLLVVIALLF